MAKDKEQQLVEAKKSPTKPKVPAEQLFTTLLKDNNLVISLGVPNVKRVDGGGLIIDAPNLLISYGRTDKSQS